MVRFSTSGVGGVEVIKKVLNGLDVDMIEYAGIGIAMGNAEECLKKIADNVTTDVDDDGVWNALKKYGVL